MNIHKWNLENGKGDEYGRDENKETSEMVILITT